MTNGAPAVFGHHGIRDAVSVGHEAATPAKRAGSGNQPLGSLRVTMYHLPSTP